MLSLLKETIYVLRYSSCVDDNSINLNMFEYIFAVLLTSVANTEIVGVIPYFHWLIMQYIYQNTKRIILANPRIATL